MDSLTDELCLGGEMPLPRDLSVLNLAYIGDAVYEIMVRTALLKNGAVAMSKLHKEATGIVCAAAQAVAIEKILPMLTEKEEAVYKRGRNSNVSGVPRHSNPSDYRKATGVEALFGYLYLTGEKDRITELMEVILKDLL